MLWVDWDRMFEAVWPQMRERLSRDARRMCLSEDDAEDAVSDVCLALLSKYRGRSRGELWLLGRTILVNSCIDRMRRASRDQAGFAAAVRMWRGSSRSAEGCMVDGMLAEQLLSRIGRSQAVALQMVAAGYSYAEVAAVFGVSVSAVNAWIWKTRARLNSVRNPGSRRDVPESGGCDERSVG